MARTLSIALLFTAFAISTCSISPFDLSHLPTQPLCLTPLAGAENSAPAASYIYDAASFFHPNPQRLAVPQQLQAAEKLASNPLLAAVMPYAQQYMSHRTKSTQKTNGVGAGLGDGTSNTTVHAWFIIFLVILGGLAWTAHHTVKSAEDEERKEKEKKEAEQAEKDKFKRSLVVGPLETIEVPIEDDEGIVREDDQYQQRDGDVAHYADGQGNNRYVNPNYYSEHENTYVQQENGYSQQEPSYYENQEPVHYNQGNDQYEQRNDQYDQGSSNYDPHQQQQNGQYYDDRRALDQYGASQGPSDYEGQAQYGNYQYEDDQDLANLVDDEK